MHNSQKNKIKIRQCLQMPLIKKRKRMATDGIEPAHTTHHLLHSQQFNLLSSPELKLFDVNIYHNDRN